VAARAKGYKEKASGENENLRSGPFALSTGFDDIWIGDGISVF
jgi:hypothetical protein